MAKPIAYFTYTKDGKVLNFRDLSLNVPTSYQWDFGDGNTSLLKDPNHTYQDEGFYQISLIATNIDGPSDPLIIQIGVGNTSETLDIPLFQLVDQYIDDTILGYSTTSEKITSIYKWQTYLQPLVFQPFEVGRTDTHNEFAWPLLANHLIAMLVSYDLIAILTNRAVTSLLTGIGVSTDETTGSNDGNVKKITTGPTEVEFHDASDQSSKSTKSLGALLNSDGISIKTSICNLSSYLRIYLPNICERLSTHVIPFKIGYRFNYNFYNDYSFFPTLFLTKFLNYMQEYDAENNFKLRLDVRKIELLEGYNTVSSEGKIERIVIIDRDNNNEHYPTSFTTDHSGKIATFYWAYDLENAIIKITKYD